jgi:hypothetical protein
MTFSDVFNGDADGICALHQLRLAQPRSVGASAAAAGKLQGDAMTCRQKSSRE